MLSGHSPFKWIFIALSVGLFGFGLSVLWGNYNRQPERIEQRKQIAIMHAHETSIFFGLACLDLIYEQAEHVFPVQAPNIVYDGPRTQRKPPKSYHELLQAAGFIQQKYTSEGINLGALYEDYYEGGEYEPNVLAARKVILASASSGPDRMERALACARNLP